MADSRSIRSTAPLFTLLATQSPSTPRLVGNRALAVADVEPPSMTGSAAANRKQTYPSSPPQTSWMFGTVRSADQSPG
jgi:hypothetical protein